MADEAKAKAFWTSPLRRRRFCLQKGLEIDPNNEAAPGLADAQSAQARSRSMSPASPFGDAFRSRDVGLS
ncbi:hypothetical protein HAX54_021281 [Datura stramonium]|uniref:Uncharacterized protein n=1 Tax=Datura stramonium TaxID=4076 RepID=A0ABS8S3B3_DATST|nr:hypothetical protein [Datura stramonium]